MTQNESRDLEEVLWRGHPWILPAIIGSSVAAVASALLLSWLELTFGVAGFPLLSLPLLLWTYVVIFLIWLSVLMRDLLLRVSHTYVLRRNSLEVEIGILSKTSRLLAATGFADQQVTRTIVGRMLNVGDIVVRSDSGQELTMKAVHGPVRISAMVRDVMSTPTVRFPAESRTQPH